MQSLPSANASATQCFGTRANRKQSVSTSGSSGLVSQSESNVATQSPWIGQRIDQYVVQRLLGVGGMGEVFLAQHRWLDVPVAIKILHSEFGRDPLAAERFHREAKLAARLNHPNIVRAVDGGTIDDTCYLVTEYLDGLDLEQIVQQSGPLSFQHACWVICEMALALQHAHDHGLVHRDVKPQNAMVLADGTVKILDFGLARAQWLDAATQMTATGQFMGTVDYVSPEQALDTSSIDSRADLYSLGCTMYFLLTGRPPFSGEGFESVVSKILAHTDETPESIGFLCRGLPREGVRTLEAMMAKDPEDRIQSATEVEQRLRCFAKPIDNLVRLGWGTQPGIRPPKNNKGIFERTGDMFLKTLWIVFRTILIVTGLVEKVEVPGPTRIATKPKYRHRPSIKGIMTWVAILIVFSLIFSSIEIVELNPNGSGGYGTMEYAPVEIYYP